MGKGVIDKSYTIWCGKCGRWNAITANVRSRAVKAWRKSGWKLTLDHGWTCATCAKERKAPPAEPSESAGVDYGSMNRSGMFREEGD